MIELTTREAIGWALAFTSAGVLLGWLLTLWAVAVEDNDMPEQPKQTKQPSPMIDLHLVYAVDKDFTVRHMAWAHAGSNRRLFSICSGTPSWTISSWYGRVTPLTPEEMRYLPVCKHCAKAASEF